MNNVLPVMFYFLCVVRFAKKKKENPPEKKKINIVNNMIQYDTIMKNSETIK